MSTTTPNLGLIKPALTDVADITAMNPNWDKIDEKLGSPTISDIAANTNLNTLTTIGLYKCPQSATAATLTNCPTNVAFMLDVGQHNGTYQRLIEFKNTAPKIYFRNLYNGTWGQWYREYTTADKPTAEEIGALPSSGGTMNGNITIQHTQPTIDGIDTNMGGNGGFKIHKNAATDTDYGTYIADIAADGGRDVLIIRRSGSGGDKLQLAVSQADDTYVAYKIYGEHYKPKAADIGAVPTTRKVNNKALSADITLSASDVSALPASGGTLTGPLTIKHATPSLDLTDTSNTTGGTRILKNAGAGVDYGTYISDISGTDGTRTSLVLHRDGTLDQTAYLRVENEDGSSFDTFKLYGEHNTHVGLKTYNVLSQIGVTVGDTTSETIANIAAKMPNNSVLIFGVTTSNATIYPNQYGLCTVKRTSQTRIEFSFTTTNGRSYSGFYSITSNGDSWSGWKEAAQVGSVSQIASGSYTGTGGAGVNSPTSITFPFAPKLVFLGGNNWMDNSETNYVGIVLNQSDTCLIHVSLLKTDYVNTYGSKKIIFLTGGGGTNWNYIKKSADGKTITWYSESEGAGAQRNGNGAVYRWVAIG